MSVNQYRTLYEAVEDLNSRGFTTGFIAAGESLKARNTGKSYPPEQVRIVEHHRFEGETNPDDMSVVYAVETTDGTRGVLTDAYGAYANPAIGELLQRAVTDEEV